jgi:hypothetical protein
MRRTMLIVVLTAVAAAAAAAGVTTILSDDDGIRAGNASLPTPIHVATQPPRTTREPTVTESPTPSPTDTAESSPTPTSSARNVECSNEPRFCSETHGMTLQDGRYAPVPVDEADTDYGGSPTISMSSKVLEGDESEAETGDEISSIHVEVLVENKTGRTFVFESREIVLELRRNGRTFDILETKGEGFEMTPQGRMTGTFDRPVTMDGTYTWQAKTYYRAK